MHKGEAIDASACPQSCTRRKFPLLCQVGLTASMSRAAMNSSVLIVDDEENLLVLLDRLFEKKGFQVKTTNNGDQAL